MVLTTIKGLHIFFLCAKVYRTMTSGISRDTVLEEVRPGSWFQNPGDFAKKKKLYRRTTRFFFFVVSVEVLLNCESMG